MSMMANSQATQAMRVQTDPVSERKATAVAPQQAGALAGQFAAMLETLNGVDAVDAPADGVPALPTAQPPARLGVGAVSLFAQDSNGAAAGQAPDLSQQDPGSALQVVESAMQAGDGSNFRWLTTLLTQNT